MPNSDFLPKYSNPKEYDETFTGPEGEELDFYINYVKNSKSVLYFGSGTGRLLKEFLKINKNITAVEFSKEMVNYSRKLLPNAKILHKNVLELDLGERFDLILAPYRFLTHFNESELKKLFSVVSKHLSTNGVFVGDIFSPYLPHDRSIKKELQSEEKQGNIIEKVYNCYDHENQICVEIVEKTDTKTGKSTSIEMPWHYWYPEQLSLFAEHNGIKILNFYGSFDKELLDKDSDDLVFVISK